MPVPNKDAIVNNNMQHKLCYVNIVSIMSVPHDMTVWIARDHSMQIVPYHACTTRYDCVVL